LEIRLRELEDKFTNQKTEEKENKLINTIEKRMRELTKMGNKTDSEEYSPVPSDVDMLS